MFWLGAAVSLCYVPGVTGAYIATQWPLLSVAMPFALWRSGPLTWLHGLGLLFIAYAVLRAPFSPLPDASVFGVWLIIIMGLVVWFGTTVSDLRGLYAGLAVGGAASSAVAIAQYFGFNGIPVTSGNYAGLYVNSVQQGTALVLVAVALVSERMWFWVLPLLPGIYLANSRGAFLALAVGLLACAVRRAWVFGVLAVAAAFFLFLKPLSESDQLRVYIWQVAWDNLTWLGAGPGMFYTLLMSRGAETFYPEHAHNDALQLVFEYGVAAALPFAIFAAALRCTDAKAWPVVVAFVVAGCYSMPLYMPLTSFVALVGLGSILRSYALARGDSRYGRFTFVQWRLGNA